MLDECYWLTKFIENDDNKFDNQIFGKSIMYMYFKNWFWTFIKLSEWNVNVL